MIDRSADGADFRFTSDKDRFRQPLAINSLLE